MATIAKTGEHDESQMEMPRRMLQIISAIPMAGPMPLRSRSNFEPRLENLIKKPTEIKAEL